MLKLTLDSATNAAVRNLPYDVTEEEVTKHFETIGVPTRVGCAFHEVMLSQSPAANMMAVVRKHVAICITWAAKHHVSEYADTSTRSGADLAQHTVGSARTRRRAASEASRL